MKHVNLTRLLSQITAKDIFCSMSCTQEYAQNVSLHISKVLDEIGVNDRMVQKRRQTELTEETIKTVTQQLTGSNVTLYHFGSRTEGTTTAGLQTDTDTLVCNKEFNIVQELGEWQHGLINMLMVRDVDTPPGYCLLQITYENVSEPVHYIPDDDFILDKRRRVLMKNSWFVDGIPEGCTRHGPSQKSIGGPGFADDDLVHAYYCKSWPREAMSWLHQKHAGNWPSQEIKRQAMTDGCFVVPVGHRGTADVDLQWRISTCLTERALMFSLSISHIRCYVLLKMILKSYPILDSDDALSSFICKTVLLHSIEKTPSNYWQDHNLLLCLNFCLKFLYECVSLEHCPHFIIHENNLLARRISPAIKSQLLATIYEIIQSNGRSMLQIEIEEFGMRLSDQFDVLHEPFLKVNVSDIVLPGENIQQATLANLQHDILLCISASNDILLSHLENGKTERVAQMLSKYIDNLGEKYVKGNEFEQMASRLLSPFLCSSLGSVVASPIVLEQRLIPLQAIALLQQGVSMADISSSLKLASLYYCIGDMVHAKNILDHIQEHYQIECVQSVCGCYNFRSNIKEDFRIVSATGDIEAILHNAGFCVRYLPCEFNSIPEELQHEFFRSEFDECSNRGQEDNWMDWAVVDSIPYFYFLQYKVYGQCGDLQERRRAVTNLRQTIDTDLSLGHKETALNLLGQCMEQENRLHDALHCYTASTNLRSTNNAANFHTSQVLQRINGGP